jgi:hypothetical protein
MSTVDRTTLHGVCESVADYSTLPNKGNMAAECLCEAELSKHVYDAGQRAWLPMEYVAFMYDVPTHGGTAADHTVGVTIPAGTIMVGGIVVIADKFVAASGTPTVSIAVNAAGDVLNALDVCAESINAKVATVPLFANAATWFVATADRTITATVGAAALTAGRLYGYLMCFRNVIGGENSSSSSSSSSSSTGVSSSSSSSRLYSSSSRSVSQ